MLQHLLSVEHLPLFTVSLKHNNNNLPFDLSMNSLLYYQHVLLSHNDVIFGWTDPLDMHNYWLCTLMSQNTRGSVSVSVCIDRVIYYTWHSVFLNHVCWMTTASLSPLRGDGRRLQTFQGYDFPPIMLLSEQICPISHRYLWISVSMFVKCTMDGPWMSARTSLFTVYVSCTVLPLPHDCTFRSFKLFTGNEATAHDRDAKWRQMVDGSWPLTLVIRYGRCNWPAVFSINRHYSPLCWPAPLVALLFLEAPGSSRVSVLALRSSKVISVSLLSASLHISGWSLSSVVKHSEDHEKLCQKKCL